MFNLLVHIGPWPATNSTFMGSRTLVGYTEQHLLDLYAPGGVLALDKLAGMPALFMSEGIDAENQARVGTIHRVQRDGRDLHLTYQFDEAVAPIPNNRLNRDRAALGIQQFEFGTTHWAVKDFDLYRQVLHWQTPSNTAPAVFTHRSVAVESGLVAVMMPFQGMTAVYEAISAAAAQVGMRCARADEEQVWRNPAIIQDIYDLIRRAEVVVCDLTGKNPNVFYETGISHALDKKVILITQSAADVPFDILHLRHIRYLNNGEGCASLTTDVAAHLRNLRAR